MTNTTNFTFTNFDDYDGESMIETVETMPMLTHFWTGHPDLEMQTDFRNTAFILGHFGFFIVNLINAATLLCFEGFGTRRILSNPVSKLSMAAHVSQLLSCFTSIRRYNENCEFETMDARMGTLFGIGGFFFINMSYLYLLFRNNRKHIRLGGVFWTIVSTLCGVTTMNDWDNVHFDYFRCLIAFSAATHIAILLHARRALRAGMFNAIFVQDDVLSRIWLAMVVLVGISFACAASQVPAMIYPGTGIIYWVCMVNSMIVGRVSFMVNDNDNHNCHKNRDYRHWYHDIGDHDTPHSPCSTDSSSDDDSTNPRCSGAELYSDERYQCGIQMVYRNC
eukprot:jgi/Psemu1/23678/gm1.23678_g